MKISVGILSLALSGILVGQTATGVAKDAPATTAVNTSKVAALHFLGGHWEGHVDKARIEQTCSTSDPAVMVCMFQLMDEKGTRMVEFYTFRDTPEGVEERIRFYSPDLKDDAGDGVTMILTSSSPTTLVFENPTGTYPKRSTITRASDDAFHSHIELVDKQGKASTIDADWKKAN
jgi:hypothetical protein